ncbi:MFS transporter [Rhizobium halophytocola]|uniref:MFS family permease n=1 Tax=Rhizobium halophytocola TaxID=735519 RepID=A0ABS4DUN8_9HYPH|nr:MFS transporter [Rhizobium halophytocola]MBP1849407.1 MFS family permease [Rhizobium halophytocola]
MDPAQQPGLAEDAGHFPIILQRNVLLYLSSRFLLICASQVTNVAVGWLVYDVTHSALALGLIGLAAFTPKLLISLLSGMVADHFDRRLVCAVSFLTLAAVSIGLMLMAISPAVNVHAIYAIFLLYGCARGFGNPASQAMIANLVPRASLSRLMGVSSSTGQMATIIGPALGGGLYIAGGWAPFAFAFAAFLLAAMLMLCTTPRPQARTGVSVKFSDAFAGLLFIWQKPVILGAISLDLFTVLLGGATALLPIIASEILHVGPLGLGVLRSAPAVGAMMLGLYIAYRPIERRAGVKLFTVTSIFGLATIVLGLSTNVYLSLAMLWLLGASDVFSVVIRQTLVQGDTPDAMRGRVAAVNSLFIGASNELGEFESGVTAAFFGLVPAILIGGAGTLLVSVLWALMFPPLRRRDRLIDGTEGVP